MAEPQITKLDDGTYLDFNTGIAYEFSNDRKHAELVGPGVIGQIDPEDTQPVPFNVFVEEAAAALFDRVDFYAHIHDRAFIARKERYFQNQRAVDGDRTEPG